MVMKKCLSATLCAVLFLGVMLPARAVTPSCSDITEHWAKAEIESAVQKGWVNGYPDGTFRPEENVPRSEFVKLLLGAIHLTPGSPTADYLHGASAYAASGVTLADMVGDWLTRQGWTQIALDFGLVLPSDYPGGAFLPTQPLTRSEAAVIIVRALGLVYSAQKGTAAELSFTDAGAVPQPVRGYVHEAMAAGVVSGLPDRSFGGDRPITRAEAVTMISRALSYMENGIDLNIKAYAQSPLDGRQIEIPLSVPAQVIDGCVYLPVRDLISANAALYGDTLESSLWNPVDQQGSFTLVKPFQFGAGDARYEMSFNPIGDNAWTLSAPARLLYGELMIPVYSPGITTQANLWTDVKWDTAANVLTVSLPERHATGS